MKRIAVITGASSGMGKKFVETLDQSGKQFDEIWVIARRKERLEALQSETPLRIMPLDLSRKESFQQYREYLENEEAEVGLLINCSGYGKFGKTTDTELEVNLNMVDLNCEALMAMCQMTIPFMKPGSGIINVASVAAFQPIPYINVYAATKAFVLSFSRALNRELKKEYIHVMALCPFWTKTEFFSRAVSSSETPVVKKYTAMYTTEQIISRAWRDFKKKKDVSQFGFVARFQAILAKLLPHSFVMSYWQHQQKL